MTRPDLPMLYPTRLPLGQSQALRDLGAEESLPPITESWRQ